MAKLKFKKTNEIKEKFTPLSALMLVVLIAFSVTLIGVLIWAIVISMKDERWIIYGDNYLLPNFWRNNYGLAFQNLTVDGQSLVQLFSNTFIYAIGCAFFNTLVPCITAYFAARYKFKYSKIIYFTVVIVMVIPIVGSLPSEIRTSKGYLFGLFDIFGGNETLRNMFAPYGNVWGLYLLKANFLGMYFLIFYEFFYSIPNSYFEAAKIDGAKPITLLLKIGLPMVRTLFLTVFLINFINFWNDYQTPLVFMKSYPTISRGVLEIMWGNADPQVTQGIAGGLAAVVLMFAPTLTLFIIFNKKMMGNLNVGGIKG
ncbi:MAG: ABC transporter permease subunit [Bacilli bacterium]|nr:ABC transporter permease subunit [Bacilli bacterium]